MMGEPEFWWWWVGAIILLVVEILLPGTFFLWLSISAAIVGLVLLIVPDLGTHYQLLIFAVLAVLSVIFWFVVMRRRKVEIEESGLNRRGEQYRGQIVTIVHPIRNGAGKARVGDSLWSVEGPDMPAGASARVVGVSGNRLKVEPV